MDRWAVRKGPSLECQARKDSRGFQGHKAGKGKQALLAFQEESAFLGRKAILDIQVDTVFQGCLEQKGILDASDCPVRKGRKENRERSASRE